MNKDTRIQKIAEIVQRDKDNPHGLVDILWQDDLQPMPVFKIRLDSLIYNKYNGRILSRTKSLESQGRFLNAELDDDSKLIEDLLWESNKGRNLQTLASIDKLGQEKVGIITRDGIIIDGNRRAMLLKKSKKFEYFKTVVLPVTLDENPLEVEKLETTYQMGEDEKLGYNPIEKYLKAKGLKDRGVKEKDIADWMGESESVIEQYLDVMGNMDDYLDYLGCSKIYTQLDEREDQFITLTKWLRTFYGEGSAKAFDGYRDSDVDDLKNIAFDYIRVMYEGKDFRNIAQGQKANHLFGDKKIWESFRDYHFDHVQSIKDAEGKIEPRPPKELEGYLKNRDYLFSKATENGKGISFLKENLDNHVQQLKNRLSKDQPLKLVGNAIDTLNAINQHHASFSDPAVMSKVEAINTMTTGMLKSKAPNRLLEQIIRMLKSIDLNNGNLPTEDIRLKLKEIGSIVYKMEKEL